MTHVHRLYLSRKGAEGASSPATNAASKEPQRRDPFGLPAVRPNLADGSIPPKAAVADAHPGGNVHGNGGSLQSPLAAFLTKPRAGCILLGRLAYVVCPGPDAAERLPSTR
jgi:hypothetical protein